jgi:2,4-dienoyl-CoA reductase-like NADH-dependent reductase (Old Yellow Enzyme family)
MVIVSSAPTFLREDSGYLAAGAVEENYADMVGYGRLAFAYPRFAKDIMDDAFDKKQACVTCGNCSVLMRRSRAGCAVRDEVYTKLFKELD